MWPASAMQELAPSWSARLSCGRPIPAANSRGCSRGRSEPVAEHQAEADAPDAEVVVDQALAVAVEPAEIPAHVGIEAGRVAEVDLPGAAAIAGGAVACHEAPLPGVAPVAGARLEVPVVARDIGVVVTARVIGFLLVILADAVPYAQARPPVCAVVRLDLGE